ncbi:hypothetical protein AU074_24185 [Pseudomonas sp. ATCC PTA-122608]|uniref:FAD/NAD(P)-binding protein n=1 Tax=Pseudomonas sp. ATCC PTA-122608 TaxID=1771311 RepID=UPI00096B97C4|nr:FAD/NAD(P)-binding protein [Pseudomonas sp. ATCC PTA-122608]OLY75354.1 hypothetical protein AU074_24185 [Pseudomonas sp. ATCC PTA-122608]
MELEETPYAIAVIGTGPRGVTVIERLVALLVHNGEKRPVDIYAIDATEVGCGQIWRTDQPDCLLMDNSIDEIAMFSGAPDDGPARAGHGPSMKQWIYSQVLEPAGIHVGDVFYPARKVYGQYLKFVFQATQEQLPSHLRIIAIKSTVNALQKDQGIYRLQLDTGAQLPANKVVLCTGHASQIPRPDQRQLQDFADRHPALTYIPAQPAAQMPLSTIAAGDRVGVLGLGLSFYDVLMMLTVGRGGVFTTLPSNRLQYLASGREPALIVAGSRSGVPIPVRGLQQRSVNFSYTPILFTSERVLGLRCSGLLDFKRDIYPWILAEVNLVYFRTLIEQQYGHAASLDFVEQVSSSVNRFSDPLGLIKHVLRQFALETTPLLDLERKAWPFIDREFGSPQAFEQALSALVARDLEEALQGNVINPLKAAMEVLRDTRAIQRLAVDFTGLESRSHRDFVAHASHPLSFLSAGTPIHRSQQLLALLKQGLLHIIGPRTEVTTDESTGTFVFSSACVTGSDVKVDNLIDARIPKTDIANDRSELTRQLIRDGIWHSYVNVGGPPYDTGGVAISESPFHPLDRHECAEKDLYVLGIPTEHTRWFMQVGIIRPGQYGKGLGMDANDVARDIYKELAPGTSGN